MTRLLRRTLIAFGWIIPVVAILTTGISIYSTYEYADLSKSTIDPFWRSVPYLGRAMIDLAVSPLCFFGAHLLGRKESLK